jgi:quercetin dioxygenase-like cupin family protein
MERLRFDADAAFAPGEVLLERVTVAPLSAPFRLGSRIQAAVFRVAPNGKIARHPATVPQILAVLEGTGRVSGGDGQLEPITAGEAVFWAAGEEHETESQTGLTALIIEADGLQPWRTG